MLCLGQFGLQFFAYLGGLGSGIALVVWEEVDGVHLNLWASFFFIEVIFVLLRTLYFGIMDILCILILSFFQELLTVFRS